MKTADQRLRGDSPQLNSPVLDRRHWLRRETPFTEAALTWRDRFSESRVEALIVNLSHGGAGLMVPYVPPEGKVLNLALGERAGRAVVEGRAVATRDDPDTGWTFLHMKFTHGCPPDILDLMLGDSDEE